MRNTSPKWMIVPGVVVLILAVLACSVGGSGVIPPTNTPFILPTETSQPTATQPPLYLTTTLQTTEVKENGTSPNYTIDAQVPVLQGSTDPRVINFNNEMTLLIQQEISGFKDNLRELAGPSTGYGSSFNGTYALLSGPGDILSLKFEIMIYIEGAAHPGTHNRTVTYDLQAGSDINLAQLFKPGTDYLQVISDYCLAQLTPQIPDLSVTGLDPTDANYRSWNITPDGLLITFDEYQVAAYALGAQQVVVPYSELEAVIDPHGILAGFLP
jgi:hypothetical protein